MCVYRMNSMPLCCSPGGGLQHRGITLPRITLVIWGRGKPSDVSLFTHTPTHCGPCLLTEETIVTSVASLMWFQCFLFGGRVSGHSHRCFCQVTLQIGAAPGEGSWPSKPSGSPEARGFAYVETLYLTVGAFSWHCERLQMFYRINSSRRIRSDFQKFP